MKKMSILLVSVAVPMLLLILFIGYKTNQKLLYNKVASERMEEMFSESYEGVSAVAEGTPETITLKIQNDLEHEIIFWGWSNPYILQNGTWYRISRAKPVDSPGPAKELSSEQIANKTVLPGKNKALTLEFSKVYGAELTPGDYRICATFELVGVFSQGDPSRPLERRNVWAEFVIP